MGNCLNSSEKLTAEILPPDRATVYPAVRLHGSPDSIFSAYIRFAVLHNAASSDGVPPTRQSPAPPYATARGRRSEWENPVSLPVGTEYASGSRDALLQFIDARFPSLSETAPCASSAAASGGVTVREDEKMSLMVRVTRLQHKSVTWHVERMVRWAEDLATRGGRKAVDPKMGSWKMEMGKFGRSYSQLLEVMMEHAQMEERILFPIFDTADRGTVSKKTHSFCFFTKISLFFILESYYYDLQVYLVATSQDIHAN